MYFFKVPILFRNSNLNVLTTTAFMTSLFFSLFRTLQLREADILALNQLIFFCKSSRDINCDPLLHVILALFHFSVVTIAEKVEAT